MKDPADQIIATLTVDGVRAVAEKFGAYPLPPRRRVGLAEWLTGVLAEDYEDFFGCLQMPQLQELAAVWSPSAGIMRGKKAEMVSRLIEIFEGLEENDVPELNDELDDRAEAQELRDYQQAAVDAVMRHLRASTRPSPAVLHVATGGGKTRIANEVVRRHLVDGKSAVLWVTKDWLLLRQACVDFCQQHGMREEVCRVGGAGEAIKLLPDGGRRLMYTTLQTLGARLGAAGELRALHPGLRLVVWDESHWAEKTALGDTLLGAAAAAGVPVLGLTATPRKPADGGRFEVVFSKTYRDLVDAGVLADAKVRTIETGFAWKARKLGDQGDFDGASLRKLAAHGGRNRKILDLLTREHVRLRKTLVFACTVAHAKTLIRRLGKECPECEAVAVHSGQSYEENVAALMRFKKGKSRVLVNVNMLTHGYDVPEIETIVLTRPTLSDMLFAQMIGRGARIAKGKAKTQFNVIDFTDNVVAFEDQLVTAVRFFEGTTGENGASASTGRRAESKPERIRVAPRGTVAAPRLPQPSRSLSWRMTRQLMRHLAPGGTTSPFDGCAVLDNAGFAWTLPIPSSVVDPAGADAVARALRSHRLEVDVADGGRWRHPDISSSKACLLVGDAVAALSSRAYMGTPGVADMAGDLDRVSSWWRGTGRPRWCAATSGAVLTSAFRPDHLRDVVRLVQLTHVLEPLLECLLRGTKRNAEGPGSIQPYAPIKDWLPVRSVEASRSPRGFREMISKHDSTMSLVEFGPTADDELVHLRIAAVLDGVVAVAGLTWLHLMIDWAMSDLDVPEPPRAPRTFDTLCNWLPSVMPGRDEWARRFLVPLTRRAVGVVTAAGAP